MLKVLNLLLLQARYAARCAFAPVNARYFWFHLHHFSCSLDRWLQPSQIYKIPVEIAERILPGIDTQVFSLEDYCEEFGGISLTEAKILARSIRKLQPKTLFEFGTFNGGSTLQFALNAPKEATVHTIDLPENSPMRSACDAVDVAPVSTGHRFAGKPAESKICQLFGNTADYDFSPFEGICDWIFIDAAHTYEFVRSDTENALRMLRPGGVIFWHDVNTKFDGVCRVVEELAQAHFVRQIAGTSLAVYKSDTQI